MLYKKYFKTLFDYVFAITLLFASFPATTIIIFLQFILNDKQIFYIQRRHTKNLREFDLYKFKTMREIYDAQGFLKPDNERLTSFGKILRALKLDEIPNLINVLRGEISFVGPRPLPVAYTSLLSEEQKKRYSVKSGITGLAQSNKQITLSWNHRIKLDLVYIQNITFFGDLKILISTIFFLSRHKVINEFEGKSIDTYKPNFND